MSFSRWLSRLTRKTSPIRRRLPLSLEQLEDRTLMTVQPLTLADPSLYGLSGNGVSSAPSLSTDGQLAVFQSSADNLVPNDTDAAPDAFVYNRSTGTVTLVSAGLNGMAAGIDPTINPVISPDGQFVVFGGTAGNLVPGFTNGNGTDELYLHDLATGTTSLLSVAPDGQTAADRSSRDPIFSADSHHVGFISDADNLANGVTFTNQFGNDNVFERNLSTDTTALVSVSLDGKSDGNAVSGPFGLSANGQFVTFESVASNLVTIDNNGINQVYVRDLAADTTGLVSVDVSGLASGGGHDQLVADAQVISADGRYVVFFSNATNLVSTPVGGTNAYLRDRQTGTTTLVSASAVDGSSVGAGSEVVSPDGRWVAFTTNTSGVVSQPTNGSDNVYIVNIQTGAVSLVSVNTTGTAGGNGDSGTNSLPGVAVAGGLWFSANGSELAFQSNATNLTGGVAAAVPNLYARNLGTNQTVPISPDEADTDGGNGASDGAAFSANGRYVAFTSLATNLAAGQSNRSIANVFVRDDVAGVTNVASAASPLLPTAFPVPEGGTLGSVSANGNLVAFTSGVPFFAPASELTPSVPFDEAAGFSGVYVRDRQTGAVQAIDLAANGREVSGVNPVISADGQYVAFLSASDALLPSGVAHGNISDISHYAAVFLRNLSTGTTNLVSLNAGGNASVDAGVGAEIAISADDNYVAYTSPDPGAVAGVTDPNSYLGIYLWDRQTGETVLVSHDASNDGKINGSSNDISISSNGQFVTFVSNDPGLTGLANQTDVFEFNRGTGQVSLVSVKAAGTGPGDDNSGLNRPVMTPDGRYIAFDSSADDLVTNASGTNVFLRDTVNGTTSLISINAAGSSSGNSTSINPSINAAGTEIAFTSAATDLTADAIHAGTFNVFVRTLGANPSTALVSLNATDTASGNSNSLNPVLSADGRYVAFASAANDLVPGYVSGSGGSMDLYLRDLQQSMTKLVTVDQSGTAGGDVDQSSDQVQFSGDGSSLAFDSPATDLFAGDRNYVSNVYATASAGFSSISGQVFNDVNGNGTLNNGETGLQYWTVYLDANANGKLDPGEPSVLTDSKGNYSLTGLTAGTYTVAIVPQSGYVQTTPPSTYTVTITTDGTAVTGKIFGEVRPIPDLAALSVSFSPVAVAPGDTLTVNWTVKNEGTGPAAGSWQDAVYLSPTATPGPNALLLATVSHDGGLASGAQYNGVAQVVVPPVQGNYYLIVQADRRDQVAQDVNRANNIAASTGTVSVSVPMLALGQPFTDQFQATGQDRYYQITLTVGETLLLAMSGSPANEANAIYVSFGALPTTYESDAATTLNGVANPELAVPVTQSGTYYILVHNQSGIPGPFTLTATRPGLTLLQASPTAVGNAGQSTLAISGIDLQPGMTYTLSGPGGQVTALSTQTAGTTQAYATFDLTGATPGSYSLAVNGTGGATATLAAAVQVNAGVGGSLQTSLIGPTAIRTNHQGTLQIDYANTGDADEAAPLIYVNSPSESAIGLSQGSLDTYQNLFFLAISQVGPAGVLRPGAHFTVPVLFQAPATAGAANQFQIVVVRSDSIVPINWAQVQGWVSPFYLQLANWSAIWANLQQRIGPTWGDFVQMLDRNATLLPPGGTLDDDDSPVLGAASDPLTALDMEVQKAAAAVSTSISGTLQVTGLGAVVAGQSVMAQNTTTGDVFSGTTLNDGSFVITTSLAGPVTAGTYTFSVPGTLMPSSPTVIVGSGQAVTGVILQASIGAEITGLVRAQTTGIAIAAADVVAVNETDGSSYDATTDANGNYTLTGLPAGVYALVINATDFARAFVSGVNASNGTVESDVSMATESVMMGTVSPQSGGPTPGAITISAQMVGTDDSPHTFLLSSTTLAFQLGGMPAGVYDVTISLDGYLDQTLSNLQVPAGGALNLGTIALPLAAGVSGVVTSTDPNTPVAGIEVDVVQNGLPLAGTQTDSSGNFSIGGLTAGTYTFQLPGAVGLVSAPSVTLTAGQQLANVAISVQPGGVIAGTVTSGQNGTLLSGTTVLLLRGDGALSSALTNTSGAYSFGGLAAGNYQVYLPVGGATTAQAVTVTKTDGTVVGANLQLGFVAQVAGVVTTAAGAPISNAVVSLEQAGQSILATLTDSNGRYDFLLLQAGTYDLIATTPDASFAPATGVVVTAGADVEQDFVAGTGTLQVNFTGAADGVGANVQLQTTVGGQTVLVASTTVAYDFAVFQGLAPGAYTVQVETLDQSEAGQGTASVTAGQSGSVAISLAALSQLSGLVTDSAGLAVPNATVAAQSTSNPAQSVLVLTANDGSFVLSGLPSGTYDLTVTHNGDLAQVQSGITVSGNTTVNVALAPSTTLVTGQVIDQTGAPVTIASIQITDSTGHAIGSTGVNTDGSFSITTAAGASLTLKVTAPGYAPAAMAGLSVAIGKTTALGSVTLHAIAAAGTPATGPQVAAVLIQTAARSAGINPPLGQAPSVVPIIPPQSIIAKVPAAPGSLQLVPQDPNNCCPDELKAAQDLRDDLIKQRQKLQDMESKLKDTAKSLGQDLTKLLFDAAKVSAYLGAFELLDALLKALGKQSSTLEKIVNQLRQALLLILGGLVLKNDIVKFMTKLQNYNKDLKTYNSKLSDYNKTLGKYEQALKALNDCLAMVDENCEPKAPASLAQPAAAPSAQPNAALAAQAATPASGDGDGDSDDGDGPDEPAPPPINAQPQPPLNVPPVAGFDPNNLVGPGGFGTQNFVGPRDTLAYSIGFENDPTKATAPVQDATVTEQLDANLDWTTFQLGNITFGTTTIGVPADLQAYQTTVTATNVDSTPLQVDVSASLNRQTGLVTWTFLSVDPGTGLTPLDPFAGFLPVDDSTGRGEATVGYTVQAKPSDVTGTKIGAQAAVVFDTNAPLNTNTVSNTIDAGAPTSTVTALPAIEPATSFTVNWSGSDDASGSGIATYSVFVSDNGGPFTALLTGTTLTSTTFAGQVGHTYGFYSVATDNVGNVQPTPTSAQATTTVNTPTTIGGTALSTSITDKQTATPFSGVTFTDPDVGETYSISVALSTAGNGALSTLSGGAYSAATGIYTLSNVSLATAQAAVRALVFTPTANQVAPGSTVKTTFTITVTDGGLMPSDSSTTVTATSANDAPVITGTIAKQAVNAPSTIAPFTGVTLADPDVGETFSLTVTLGAAANGTLSNLSGGTYTSATGVYSLSNVSLAAAQTALRALVFNPTPAGSSQTTTFTIGVNDGIVTTTDSTTSVVATASQPLAITTTTLPTFVTQGQPYNATIATTGGVAPIAFSVPAGALPAGLTLAPSTGVISGTPTAYGTSTFTVQAQGASGAPATQAYTVVILPPEFVYNQATETLVITLIPSLPSFQYTQLTTVAGGATTSAYAFTLSGSGTTVSQTFTDSQLTTAPGTGASVTVTGQGLAGTAILITNDTYTQNGQKQETPERISLGSLTDAGVGTMSKFIGNSTSNPSYTFLTLKNFPVSYAYAGRADGTIMLQGTEGTGKVGFVTAGYYSYIAAAVTGDYAHFGEGTSEVIGTSAGNAADFAYHYTSSAPSTVSTATSVYTVNGITSSSMQGSQTNPEDNGAVDTFNNLANGFVLNTAVSYTGNSIAHINDSPLNDTYVAQATDPLGLGSIGGVAGFSYMYVGAFPAFGEFDVAYGFGTCYATATNGGHDIDYPGAPANNVFDGDWIQSFS